MNGCTTITGPNGPVATCLCPEGTLYDSDSNTCGCPETCAEDDDCCSGVCCDGTCCPEGTVCCGGMCKPRNECVCPPGLACSGSATCNRCGNSYTTVGMCCSFPNTAYCCSDSSAGKNDGFAICCQEDVDCPPCPESGTAMAGRATLLNCCNDDGDACTDFDSCCADSNPGGSITLNMPCCVSHGLPCEPDGDPPCCGACVAGTCQCLPDGAPCGDGLFECCGQGCDLVDGRKVCGPLF